MDQQKQNFIRDMMVMSELLLEDKDKMEALVARWNLNDFFNTLDDEEIAAIPEFKHLSVSEIGNAITAMNAFLAAMGDSVSGQTVNLVKMKS